ncbi:transglutaminase family protein [Methylocystis parvus]|uniref:Transglutaminase family protein n=1 Tax=Methylocystis parvus TaxID=134 RepID=A0A6B8M7N4_9HYPH|nr:transglutaminase family protein [Methylocystis parvus]QGM97343.1 transglutaminase family protein [Methylocystis parvus]WBJ98747.1 transglutaminase family protein [Methylocystis parvus OBBP]
MRIRIRHETTYRYVEPAKFAIQHLRLTPRNFDGQHVKDWRIDVDRDCRLLSSEDAFGNIVHRFTAEGPFDSLTTMVEGDITTFDTAGVASGALERFPPALYLRTTPLTAPSAAIVDFARAATAGASGSLASLHALLAAIHEKMDFDTDATHAATTAAESFERGKGVCQDFAHLFIACARALGAPARYVSGYYLRTDGDEQVAGHAWAEAYVPDLGWVGFDPAQGFSPGERHVRLAIALDYLSAAPIRGSRTGGAGETMEVKVRVAPTQSQSQSQSQ